MGPGHRNVSCSRQRRTKWSCPPGLGQAPREDRSDAVAGGCCLSTLCLLSHRVWNHRAQRRPRSLDVSLGRVSGARQDTVFAVPAFYQTPLGGDLEHSIYLCESPTLAANREEEEEGRLVNKSYRAE